MAFDFDVLGVVYLRETDAAAGTITLAFAIPEARTVSRLPAQQAALNRVAEEVRVDGALATYAEGRMTETRIVQGASSMAANVYRQVASTFQFATDKAGAKAYTSREYDTTGQYTAQYSYDDSLGAWRRKKQSYIALLSSPSDSASLPLDSTRDPSIHLVPQVMASDGEVDLGEGSTPTRILSADETVVQGAQTPVHSLTRVSLDLEGSEPATATATPASLSGPLDRVGAEESFGAPPPVDVADDARIKGRTFAGVLAQLEQSSGPGHHKVTGADGGVDLSRLQLFEALSAIFRKQPNTVDLAVARILAHSPAAGVLIEALGSASSVESQAALLKLRESKGLSDALHDKVLLALIRTPRPSAASIEALKTSLAADPFDGVALLGLGTYARHLRDDGRVEEGNALANLLARSLASATTDPKRVRALTGLANAGSLATIPAIVPYLDNDNEDVRAEAVVALRSMRNEGVDAAIASKMSSDTSRRVRIAALEAAGVRAPTDDLVHGVSAAATEAPDPHVRYRAVELAVRWLPRRPDLHAMLQQVAASDPEQEVRGLAAAAL